MFRISLDLLPIKAHYFLYNSAQGCYLYYLSVAGKQGGIPASVISWIFGVAPLVSATTKFTAGYIADRIQNITVVLMTLELILTVACWGVFIAPEWTTHSLLFDSYVTCPETISQISSFPNTTTCELFCDGRARQLHLNDSRTNCFQSCGIECKSSEPIVTTFGLIIYGISVIVAFAISTTIYSVSDAACYGVLGPVRGHLYGRQRLWGTLGWGIVSPLIGVILDATSSVPGHTNFTASVVGFTIFYAGNLILLFSSKKFETPAKSPNFFRDLGSIFSNVRVIVFAVWVLMCGILVGVVWTYSVWLLVDLKASKTLIGITFTVQSLLIEFPMFFMSGYVIKTLGHFGCMTAAFVCFAIKFFGYAALTNPWYAVLIDFAGGAIFPLFYASMTAFASITATTGTEATMQCIFGATFEGIGMAIGNFVGARLIAAYGSQYLFRICGVCAVICAVGSFASSAVLTKKSDKTSHETQRSSLSNERSSPLCS